LIILGEAKSEGKIDNVFPNESMEIEMSTNQTKHKVFRQFCFPEVATLACLRCSSSTTTIFLAEYTVLVILGELHIVLLYSVMWHSNEYLSTDTVVSRS